MNKPLELMVYPPAMSGGWGDMTPPFERDWALNRDGISKRLTDAELAAEEFRLLAWLGALWRTVAAEDRRILIAPAWTFGPITRDEHEWQVMHRFATHPHYDEVTT